MKILSLFVAITDYKVKFLSQLGFFTEVCYFLSTVRQTDFIHNDQLPDNNMMRTVLHVKDTKITIVTKIPFKSLQ